MSMIKRPGGAIAALATGAALAAIVVGVGGAGSTNSATAATTAAPISWTAYTTGYGWWDNTPPGSSDIAYPMIHQTAGGTGTYTDPITLAVGHSIINGVDIPDFAPGTIWYIPNLRRYFIVEDACGDGNDPQDEPCHDLAQAPTGAQVWLDLWVDGSQMTEAESNACEDAITDLHLAIENPPSDYAVVPGPIAGTACSQQYGDTIVTVPPPTTTMPTTTTTTTTTTPTTTTTTPTALAPTTLPPTTKAPITTTKKPKPKPKAKPKRRRKDPPKRHHKAPKHHGRAHTV